MTQFILTVSTTLILMSLGHSLWCVLKFLWNILRDAHLIHSWHYYTVYEDLTTGDICTEEEAKRRGMRYVLATDWRSCNACDKQQYHLFVPAAPGGYESWVDGIGR